MSTWGGQNAVETSSRVPVRVQLDCCLSLASCPRIYLCALGLSQSAWEDYWPHRDLPSWRLQCLVVCLHWLWKPEQPQLFRVTQLYRQALGWSLSRDGALCRTATVRKKQIWPWDFSFPAGINWANDKLLWVCSAAPFVSSSARFYHFPTGVANAQQCNEQEQPTDQAEN